ncbi:MAG: DNA alkylation repair protein [Phycisphaerales bacterium]
MPPKQKKSDSGNKSRAGARANVVPIGKQVESILATLKRLGKKSTRDEMGPRYGITGATADTAFGVSMGDIKATAKAINKNNGGPNHELALALWETCNYEARLLTSLVDDPKCVTPAQMDRWCKDFDNWGVCDTVCFNLFDRTPHVADKVAKWAKLKGEYQKRAAFALLACAALHDKTASDETYLKFLPLIRGGATDERNFVKKGVLWALRGIGHRTPKRRAAALDLANELAEYADPTARWIGTTARREMTKG